ncbi:glucosamine-6-phosphate deaminase [Arthrobacter roseus]|uniref:glucosamine-6-phosphate deaminase n=1 Tax=Arthrobacter roseus TaxID=136274 RepID=UPI0019654309|nr:glucosamine-6-phosphate deaminase [Arthrobacter roseus]MBM7846914.1 glucosamine-6-phosphate deaminase [Arthrobacter roseus]
MEVLILPRPADVGAYVADLFAERIQRNPGIVLGVATGSSPLATYRALANRKERESLQVEDVQCFALDEYVGLPAHHPGSYATFVESEITVPLGLNPANIHVPDGAATNLDQACLDYEQAISDHGGIDLQILGIGANGHIGFNEPTSSLSSRTRIKALSSQTREDNARFFEAPDAVPTHCITQGLGTIMDVHEIVLVAQGTHKAAAVAAAVEGPVAGLCPASILQFHPRITFVLDEEAASNLSLRDYYRSVQTAKSSLGKGSA